MWTNRKKVLLAGTASALLHALLLLGVAVAVALQPSAPPPEPPPEPMHLELVKSEPVPPRLATPAPEHKLVDTTDLQAADHPTKDALFEGAKDTRAASSEPPTGDKLIPTQQGRTAPTYAFDTHLETPGAPAEAAPAAPPPATAPAPPAPAPDRARAHADGEEPVPTLVRNDLAMLDAAPEPTPPEEDNPYDPAFRSTAPPLPTPAKRKKTGATYHPMSERTASSGSISFRGAASVDAVATPFGKYQLAVVNSIRPIWSGETESRRDIASVGSIKVHLAIDRFGHVHTPRIIENSANEASASIALDAVTTAVIPPIPPELIQSMDGAMLECDLTFECL